MRPAIPATMQAVWLTGHGGFERLSVRDDVPVPMPRADDVLIRVAAAGVNATDVNMREGWYARSSTESLADAGWTGSAVEFPLIQGADACGEIVAVGARVPEGRIGERVLVDPVLRPAVATPGERVLYLGSDCDGAFAEFVRVPAVNAHRLHSALSDAALASFPCSYSAAENMLTRAAVGSDDLVLITGASGGVGSAAVQLARRRGARVIALAAGSKADDVAALGAETVLSRDADLVAVLGRESVDVAIDMVGGRSFESLLDVLRRGGRYAVAGAIGGHLVTMDLRTVYLKDLSVFGCTIPSASVFPNLVHYIEAGEIGPLVAATFPLRAIADAQRAFLDKRHTGKIVLLP